MELYVLLVICFQKLSLWVLSYMYIMYGLDHVDLYLTEPYMPQLHQRKILKRVI